MVKSLLYLPELQGIVWIDPERLGGIPCFYGTRVPVQHLFDYLEGGESISDFLDGFEGVTYEQVRTLLTVVGKLFISQIIQETASDQKL